MFRKWWITAIMAVVPALGGAQSNSDSATYRRAQMLVNDGNAIAGRAIVDSMIARTTPGTNEYAEGLYWRAVLSATAADAEMDYRRIIVDHPLSPRVEDVLLRLAQLELARADYDGALQHLNRLILEHPGSTARARAGYWAARVLFERNDIQRACTVNADALARTGENDAELRNQISYLNQRCVGVAIGTPPSGSANDSATVVKSETPLSSPVPVTGAASVPVTAPSLPAAQKPRPQPPTVPRDASPTMIEPTIKESVPVGRPVLPKPPTTDLAAEDVEYSVQVAAYNVKSQADAMVVKLRKKGYEARVSGTTAPFRVRIGYYATQGQASAVMRSLKTKQIVGFVVKAEPR
jgi:cell division septation protein DedD